MNSQNIIIICLVAVISTLAVNVVSGNTDIIENFWALTSYENRADQDSMEHNSHSHYKDITDIKCNVKYDEKEETPLEMANAIYSDTPLRPKKEKREEDSPNDLPVGTMNDVLDSDNEFHVPGERLMMSTRHHRLRGHADHIRGDLQIKPQEGNWFQTSHAKEEHLHQGALKHIA